MIAYPAEVVRTRLRQRHIRIRRFGRGHLRIPLTMPCGLNDYVWGNTTLQVTEVLMSMIRNNIKRSKQVRVLPKRPLFVSEVLLSTRNLVKFIVGTFRAILRRDKSYLMSFLCDCTRQIVNNWFKCGLLQLSTVTSCGNRQISWRNYSDA